MEEQTTVRLAPEIKVGIRKKLFKVKRKIESELIETEQQLREEIRINDMTAMKTHTADINCCLGPAVNGHRIANLKKRLIKTDKALAKVDDDTYGLCTRCGDEIPAGRLISIPIADLCTLCKEKLNLV